MLGIELPPAAPDWFEVEPENWDAVQMFLSCQTQWRVGGMGGPVGLDYGAVAWVFSLYGVKDPRSLLEDLQVMEAAVLETMSKGS